MPTRYTQNHPFGLVRIKLSVPSLVELGHSFSHRTCHARQVFPSFGLLRRAYLENYTNPMSIPLESYLRTYRKRSGFSQEEIASLLGCQSGAKVSRYEQGDREPNLHTVFAYEVIFRASASLLFAGMYEKVERSVRERARLLADRIADAKPDRATSQKLAILESLASGLDSREIFTR